MGERILLRKSAATPPAERLLDAARPPVTATVHPFSLRHARLTDGVLGNVVQRVSVIQRVLDGTDFTRAHLATKAEESGVATWKDGEFLTHEKDPFTTANCHVHLYAAATVSTTAVSLKGHAIWNKKDGICRQPFTLAATETGGRWTAKMTLEESEIAVLNKNPESKAKLYEEVVDKLAEFLADALNES